ncbi:MAG: phenylalanine--tRNA ligase subunit beta [Candidatus Omnitrophica bacterium]|jgi:phenylalanyl-tRNA synthetase beta chain|nr:phenylalanine--tRNA ligase subunit beta [Candidatus Omnitrophota bacterium]
MKFSLNFLKEFLDIKISPKELAERLTAVGMEVEHWEKKGNDWIFDIEVTSNRYDWLSILGIARETAAVLRAKGKFPTALKRKPSPLTAKKIIIENSEDCCFYIGQEIKNIKVKVSKPQIREKISNCGINPVNDIVDITNYCMLKWGNPLHAFDSDKIEGDIYIRRALSKEAFLGIDGKERILNKENLVIADAKKVIALAGVMGAKNTEVDSQTKNIFLEAAIFSPLTVRRSRRAAGLDTESSYRFERTVCADYLELASQEAVNLITELSKGSQSGFRVAGKKPILAVKKIIIDLAKLDSYAGISIPKAEVVKILTALGFKTKTASAKKIIVSSAAYRFDIKREVDVYEEIIRLWGYDKIPVKIPSLASYYKKESSLEEKTKFYHFKNELRKFMSLVNFKEIITYSIDDQEPLDQETKKNVIKILNPLKNQENILRPNLFLGMLKSIKYNLNRNQDSLALFEIADIYLKEEGFKELAVLSLGLSGNTESFFKLKAAVVKILRHLDISHFSFVEKAKSNFTNTLEVIINNKSAGFLGKLDEKQKNIFDLKEDFFFGQLGISFLAKNKGKKLLKVISPYPALWRDISISLKKSVKFKEIEEIIRQSNSYLSDLQVVDFYQGKDISGDSLAFTLRIFYQSQSRTLTAEEVDSFHNNIRHQLSLKEGVSLR